MIGLETARQLLDFRGRTGALSAAAAEEQLKGAVALHNILRRKRVAYLADEVGMGKTYVALGALALFRHFDPRLRVLVIAPRANIQKKWIKELRNFVRNNVRVADLRVKAVHGAPARPVVSCANLAELVRETALNPDRDFFVRLSSFSLPLGKDSEGWKKRRKELLDHVPWADASAFPLNPNARAQFKDAYGRTLCAALPEFDLVIVDEGHNLKHGFGENVSARNRVLGLAFGHPDGTSGTRGYGPRAKRVLFLSATPLEADYRQLWNQLDVFGLGHVAPELGPDGKGVDDDKKRACAQEFLIRRLTEIPVGEQRLTKNLYRREWRAGGVADHDHPLEITGPDRDRQRLVVALVQKKVSEVLGHAKFNNSFQIGMLASFESFLQTAKVLRTDDDEASNFDGDQTDDPDERFGADVGQINKLAANYRKTFDGSELPHPKMDALIDHLATGLPEGRKALVFVRRVASVKELQTKLEERYDEWLFDRLRRELPALQSRLGRAIDLYREERSKRRTLASAPVPATAVSDDEESPVLSANARDAETSGLDSFFAWFFRGDGPEGFLSGAALKKRFERPGSAYSTFFEDNYVAWLLDARPGTVLDTLAAHLGRDRNEVIDELRKSAAPFLPPGKTARAARRLHLFIGMQTAALELLGKHRGPLGERAGVVLHDLSLGTTRHDGGGRLPDGAESWLETRTFFTELRARPELRESLWPEPKATLDARAALREQELRRYLLSAQARLGHAFLDLYVLAMQGIGDLRPRARDDDSGTEGLVERYLDLLEQQRLAGDGQFRAFQELSLTAEHFDLIVDVNRPDLRDMPLSEAGRAMGQLLGSQQPVGGMFGAINDTLVRQFRLPGYPLVLFTTNLLQEGEDLHTFCSALYHYGIEWMPSSMEQRVGRIDRVNSHTERRLTRLAASPEGAQKLQVYYPYLRETVEVLQVRRVLKRMNTFMRLMHRDLRQPDEGEQRVDIAQAMLEPEADIATIAEVLETAFPVRADLLDGPDRTLAVPDEKAHELVERFRRLGSVQPVGLPIEWEHQQPSDDMLLGTAWLMDGRRQPFSLILRSLEGRLMVRCVSPVGRLEDGYEEVVRERTRNKPIQVGIVWDDRFKSYNANVEGEVLLGPPAADANRVVGLIHRVISVADELERELLQKDEPLSAFQDDIKQESPDADN